MGGMELRTCPVCETELEKVYLFGDEESCYCCPNCKMYQMEFHFGITTIKIGEFTVEFSYATDPFIKEINLLALQSLSSVLRKFCNRKNVRDAYADITIGKTGYEKKGVVID